MSESEKESLIDEIKEELYLNDNSKGVMDAVQEKLIKHNDSNEIIFKKNKLKNIVELYAESGKWDYWSISG